MAGVFPQKNIRGAYQVSKKSPESMVKVIRISAPARDAVYNYSIQTLNSTELAKKELYREMAKEPRKRFTYSQDYLSAMVEPQGSEEEKKKARKQSRQAWLTATGFQVTGLHRSTDNDRHLRLPAPGTIRQEWRENAQFANGLAPFLDQERWSWDRRRQDFDLYTKPPPLLDLPPSPALKPLTELDPLFRQKERSLPGNLVGGETFPRKQDQTKALSPPSRETQKGTLAPVASAFKTQQDRERAAAGRGLAPREASAAAPPMREAMYSPSASVPTMYFVFHWKVTPKVTVFVNVHLCGAVTKTPAECSGSSDISTPVSGITAAKTQTWREKRVRPLPPALRQQL
ncbi:hypothetical protein MC885_016655 [Smutsia gigantea]|nr:hypothetical protein MC885_016655 [Smutsia gigantea]